ncbi:trans-resveratrol di-O-methyltransferase-like [Gossypium australe]|uniref:Trans-resveratrol di-O-methyltransferase-like n=1 Tax=Gossypium australe TaxID=47621 RepID=A0A5B6WN69_9ROSI|nr:trans-resveratrol di-O-methyltransferase-like [Gossypium australe]
MLFINTLKALFINHMLGSATKSFSDIVIEVNNVNTGYSKPITISQLRTVTTGHQGPPRQESNIRQPTEKLQFTPIPMTYRELYQNLFDAHVVSPST